MLRKILWHGLLAGVLTGVVMGFVFKGVESLTGVKVYTLLLNVDFVPFLSQPLPEWLEFGLHLIVSVVIAIVFLFLLNRFTAIAKRPILFGIIAGCLAIPTFIPLTLLSERTPAIDDMAALFWWIAGHLLYGWLLGGYGRLISKKKLTSSQ
jgi:hypothetical protein